MLLLTFQRVKREVTLSTDRHSELLKTYNSLDKKCGWLERTLKDTEVFLSFLHHYLQAPVLYAMGLIYFLLTDEASYYIKHDQGIVHFVLADSAGRHILEDGNKESLDQLQYCVSQFLLDSHI